MFWDKKKYYQDEDFGEMIYSSSSWEASIVHNGMNSFFVFTDGTKEKPSSEQLKYAKEILIHAKDNISKAKLFLETQPSVKLKPSNGELVLDGFDFRYDTPKFDIFFGLTLWPDASIAVHFSAGEPYEASCGD